MLNSEAGAASVGFYQVKGDTPAAVDSALPRLLEKALGAGRVVLVCPTAARRIRLDEALWTYAPGAFLPHGAADGPMPERQPVLLALPEELEGVSGRIPVVVAGAEGALNAPERLTGRIIYIFESAPTVLERARVTWKALKTAGCSLTYWQQGEKGWEAKKT